MHTPEDSPFEKFRTEKLKGVAMSPDALELVALAYESGFIDGMQKQMQSSVDRAVNRMAEQPAPVREDWGPGPHECHSLPEQPAQQEPVAWIDPKHLEWLAQSPDNLTGAGLAARQRSADMVSLYTSPQPQRKPLPPSDVVAMWHEARPAHAMNNAFDWYKRGVEDAEAAHGVKEQP